MDNTAPAIFCTLSQRELLGRKADVRKILSPHIVASSYAHGMSKLAFARPAVARTHLEHLIELEQACCPFFTFEISETDTAFTLIVSGPEGSEEFVRDLFSPENSISCGCAG